MRIIQFIQILSYPAFLVLKWIMRPLIISKESQIEGPVLIVSNHISHIDAFMIAAHFRFKEIKELLPLRIITANRFLYYQPIGVVLRMLGGFPAKPKSNKIHGLEASIKYAREGQSLLFFPQGGIEGKRAKKVPHSGAAVLGDKTNIYVLPIFLDNKDRYTIVRGAPFKSSGMNIDQIMQKVWELKEHI